MPFCVFQKKCNIDTNRSLRTKLFLIFQSMKLFLAALPCKKNFTFPRRSAITICLNKYTNTFPQLAIEKKGIHRKVSLSARLHASLTIESAFILPFFFLGMVTLISLMDIWRIQSIVTTSLCESAKELGMYAYAAENFEEALPIQEFSAAACIVYGKAQILKRLEKENLTGLKGGRGGISLQRSTCKDGVIDLKATYKYQPPFSIFPLPEIKLQSRGMVRTWTGYDGQAHAEGMNGETQEMVYVSESQGVYHTMGNCTHLVVSVHALDAGRIGEKRNDYGERYHACEKCIKGAGAANRYYITEKGNKYHAISGCSGLKRTVRLVKKSDVDNLRICSRCQSHE